MNVGGIRSVLESVEYKEWGFFVGTDTEIVAAVGPHVGQHTKVTGMWLQVLNPNGTDAVTGETALWKGRKWRLSEHMTKSEIVQTALMAVLAAEEHETREAFRYRGERIFSPHYDVDQLVELRQTGSSEDLREPIN